MTVRLWLAFALAADRGQYLIRASEWAGTTATLIADEADGPVDRRLPIAERRPPARQGALPAKRSCSHHWCAVPRVGADGCSVESGHIAVDLVAGLIRLHAPRPC
jgi:hypothetical protein